MPIFVLFLILISATLSTTARAQDETSPDPTWSTYQKILDIGIRKNTYKGKYGEFSHNAFDYKALIDHKSFQSLLNLQKEILVKSTRPSNRFDKLAFWINAYNFFTIVDVTREYPIKSMKDIGWKKKRHNVGGNKYSLDDIEHRILRPMGDPKIHFAVNCASVSCPSLSDKIFQAKSVGQHLKKLTEEAFKNPLHIRPDGHDVEVTKLMDWFGDDFEVSPFKSKEGFLKRYAPQALQKDIDGYIRYDWDLNNPENVSKAMKKLGLSREQN